MKSTLLPALAAALMLAASPFAAVPRQPNLLLVFTDDQRWDAMSVVQREQGDRARFPWLRTPHMDRLAAEGVRFRNAFVTLPLCAPSRAVFLTGRYNHLNGIANNRTPFPADSVTHSTLLRAAGYTTGYIGKWHMGNQGGKRPGFDYSASFLGQGRYFDCAIEVNGVPTPSQGWVDDVTTDYAIRFLREHRDRPFAMMLGYKATHGPFDPPERARDRFAGEQARPVPNLASRAIYRGPADEPATAAKGGATNLGYFRCISALDDNLGRLLGALDELGLAEDTVVVFSSDNGYYLGEHGLGDKRSLYEESIRIPMLARYPRAFPRGPGRRRNGPQSRPRPVVARSGGATLEPRNAGSQLAPPRRGAACRLALRLPRAVLPGKCLPDDTHHGRRPHPDGEAHPLPGTRRVDGIV